MVPILLEDSQGSFFCARIPQRPCICKSMITSCWTVPCHVVIAVLTVITHQCYMIDLWWYSLTWRHQHITKHPHAGPTPDISTTHQYQSIRPSDPDTFDQYMLCLPNYTCFDRHKDTHRPNAGHMSKTCEIHKRETLGIHQIANQSDISCTTKYTLATNQTHTI